MRILIIRFSSIGDVILTTPIIRAIKSKYPEANIDYLTMPPFADAISGNPLINQLILYDKNKYQGINGIRRFGKKLAENRYDKIIDLHAKLRSRILTPVLRAEVLRYRKRAWWKSIGVHLRLIRYQVDNTIVRQYFGALKPLGIRYTEEKLDFFFSDADARPVKSYEGSVILAPGAARNTKKWLWEYFGRLGQMLSSEEKIVLIGSKDDWKVSEEIREMIGAQCENLAGKLTLKQSGALIRSARYLVTNDSGPFHIARGVGTKVFVIFGPTDPGMFEYDNESVLIYRGLSCSPCSLHGDKTCPKSHFKCMKELTPEKVHQIIETHTAAT